MQVRPRAHTRTRAQGRAPSLACILASALTRVCSLCLQFPYYTFTNKEYMYRVGSAMYGIYFIVTFPMYFR